MFTQNEVAVGVTEFLLRVVSYQQVLDVRPFDAVGLSSALILPLPSVNASRNPFLDLRASPTVLLKMVVNHLTGSLRSIEGTLRMNQEPPSVHYRLSRSNATPSRAWPISAPRSILSSISILERGLELGSALDQLHTKNPASSLIQFMPSESSQVTKPGNLGQPIPCNRPTPFLSRC
ncbi:hypothetical protein SISSUDRAFT_1037251 [Sistotremastrum suecicum HHB10207 ss-3]|uniref:Uncharacterized protein n=1 Tax=Sistotremastrum suecicum HHB10207 ss-3 TaxID=1314776 RepID=A0A165YDI1_9AGAM|nr:hypothetical protein SISSUDRAFT_1037251 [Sistotremastrum suecicum HHB10207 ss-3]